MPPHLLRRIVAFLIFVAAVVAVYFWYVQGVDLADILGRKPPPGGSLETGLWQARSSMPTPRVDAAAAELDGKIYVVGGFDGLGQTLSTVEVYDSTSDSWETIAP